MANFSVYDQTDSPSGTETPRVFGLHVTNDIDILRRNGFGDTITSVAGHTEVYEGADNRMSMRIVRNDSPTFTKKEAMGGEYILREELDCNGINGVAMKNMRPLGVATGSLLAIADANEAVIEWDSTLKRLSIGAKTGGWRRGYVSAWDQDGGHYKRHACKIASTTTATDAVRDDIDGYLMDDGADEIRWSAMNSPIGFDYAAGKDAYLEVISVLEAAESSGDEIDMQAIYESDLIATGAFGGTLTTKSNETQTLGSGTAVGSIHRTLIKLVQNDANNPIAIDRVLRGIIKRDGLTNVGDVVVQAINLLVPHFGGVDHQI